jgi:PAS domain S-box-containing protein
MKYPFRSLSQIPLVTLFLLSTFMGWQGNALAEQRGVELVRIGVLSHRGTLVTRHMWSPTAQYLSEQVEGFRFEIHPLEFAEVQPAVEQGVVDFILVNSGIYVNLEVRYRVSRIATLMKRSEGKPRDLFGGVLLTRSDRNDLNALNDLRNRSVMAVDETSFGGFQVVWRELATVGIDPYKDFSSLQFGGIHDEVVRAVESGAVDAGIVRTDILELMSRDGSVALDQFKVINQQQHEDFPALHSTRLYPEWPFSKVRHTSEQLAHKVAVALLSMPTDHSAAQTGHYAGWTIPLEYQPVHALFEELRLPPYEHKGQFTLADAIKRYWHWLLMGVSALLFMVVMTIWVLRLNRQLERLKICLEHQNELILNSVADGIYGVDLDGNSTFVNRSMEEITGWSSEDMIGKNQHEILHHTRSDGSDHPSSECPVYQTMQNGNAIFVDDDIFWKRDGNSFPVEYSATPLRDDQGVMIGSVVIFRDISERRQIAEELSQHQSDLAHMSRLNTLGEMAAGMAHELNQPLTAIATNAYASVRLMEGGEGNSERLADTLERIGSQAERAGEIVKQLRQFVRKEDAVRSVVNICELIRAVEVLFRPEAKRAGIKVILELPDQSMLVHVQNIQIEQVILNLAVNGIEAIQEQPSREGLLTIRARSGGKNAIIVEVEDNGPGLKEEIRSELFNPFITTKPKGMGLGLSISIGIIEAHHGNLYVEPAPEGGALFRFVLPTYVQEESKNA